MSQELIALILQYGLKYGPDAAIMVKNLVTKAEPNVTDVENLFAHCKKYEDYDIPAKLAVITTDPT